MKQQSIKEEFGTIQVKLDSEADKHNRLTYYHFDLMCRKSVPRTAIGRMFNVSFRTIEHWQALRDEMLTKP